MPLVYDYKARVEGSITHLKNSTTDGRGGGSITAALFLQHFVGKKNTQHLEDGNEKASVGKPIPWAHLDIAGPVWDSGKRQATGYGVKLLTNYLLNISKSK